jgi:hypothetical protein
MRAWRKSTAAVAMTAIVASGFSSSSAFAEVPIIRASDAPTGRVDQAVPADQVALIASTIRQYPNGGEPLKSAISDLIVKRPDLAPSVALFIRSNSSLTRAQKQAIFAGLADASGQMGIVAADETIPPWVIALLLAAAGGGIACAILCGNNNTTTASPVAVPSPN